LAGVSRSQCARGNVRLLAELRRCRK
jgi:hypothetical protein